jgi:hypothetical protein
MFTKTNKLIVALGLFSLPLTIACGPAGSDDGDTGGSDDTGGQDSGGQDSGGADSTGGADSGDGSGDGADSSGGADTGSESGGAESGGTDSGGGDGANVCVATCTEDADCCENPDQCGAYPFPSCGDDGACDYFTPCVDDAECEAIGAGLDTCQEGVCLEACRVDDDCENVDLGFTCQEGFCAPEAPAPCETDDDCGGLTCDTDTGACVECLDDAACAESTNGSICLADHFCGCSEDGDCNIEGDVCVPF